LTQPAIHAVGLTKSFGSVHAVSAVDLEIERGEIFGFLGPNGAGKSTTIRMLAGLLTPTSGTAHVAGFDVISEPIEVKARIGYLAENPYAYEKLTGAEFLRFIGDLFQVDRSVASERAAGLLRRLGLNEDADKLVESYSRGMRQKLGLIAALLHAPEVLFLDEPTSGLDPRSARIVKDLLTELSDEGRTVLLSTHVLATAEQMCDRVGIIARGRLIAVGSLAQLRKGSRSTGSLEDIFLELTAEADPTG